MIEATLLDPHSILRFGNLVYYCAYQFTNNPQENFLHIRTNSNNYNEIDNLFTNVQIDHFNSEDEENVWELCDNMLDSSLSGFNTLKQGLNRKYLNSLQYDFDISNIAIINIRLGDYLQVTHNDTYKVFNKQTFDKFMCKYADELNKYDEVLVVNNSQRVAQKLYTKILEKYLTTKFRFYSSYQVNPPIYDFNLLLNAKFIIGSCSTFSFAGCMLNYNNAKMVVEFPYYRQPNPRMYTEDKQKALYNHPNIVKEY